MLPSVNERENVMERVKTQFKIKLLSKVVDTKKQGVVAIKKNTKLQRRK